MAARLDALRVLIVDDNAHMVQIVKTILRTFGVKEFLEAHAVPEAYAILCDEPVDILLTDYLMEEQTGLDLVRMIRNHEDSPNQYLPIIMLSAFAERSRVEEARDHGVNEFCAKPVTASELFRKVANVIDRPRPFVRTIQYFGPDRRRKVSEEYDGPARREEDEAGEQETAA